MFQFIILMFYMHLIAAVCNLYFTADQTRWLNSSVNGVSPRSCRQGDHSAGKPGKVREFQNGQGKVRENGKSRGKLLSLLHRAANIPMRRISYQLNQFDKRKYLVWVLSNLVLTDIHISTNSQLNLLNILGCHDCLINLSLI